MRAAFGEIEAFLATYELGNFSKAARALGQSPQATSRAVARLERAVGVGLLRRSTRHVEPTEAGRRSYATARASVDALISAEREASEVTQGRPSGEVRLSVPTTWGHHRFLPLVHELRAALPDVELDIEISNRNVDLIREPFDLAIRMGSLDDASFVARRLGTYPLAVFASPIYLEARGAPASVDDLKDHATAVFVMPRTGRILPWTFRRAPTTIVPSASVRIRGDVLGLVGFARSGAGLVQTYRFLVQAEQERGELVEVLDGHPSEARPFSLIYLPETTRRPEVRAVVDALLEWTRADREPHLSDRFI